MIDEKSVSGGGDAFGMRRTGGAQERASPVFIEWPTPPSVNNSTGVSRRRKINSANLRDWKMNVAWMAKQQFGAGAFDARLRTVEVPGRVVILIAVERSNLSADIDNLTKALIDGLVTERVIEGDSAKHVLGIATAWNPPGEKMARIAVVPAQTLNLQFQPTRNGDSGGFFLTQFPGSVQQGEE